VLTHCAAVRLTYDLYLRKLVHPVTPNLGSVHTNFGFPVFFFVFELRARTGRTDGQTDGRARHVMWPIRMAA